MSRRQQEAEFPDLSASDCGNGPCGRNGGNPGRDPSSGTVSPAGEGPPARGGQLKRFPAGGAYGHPVRPSDVHSVCFIPSYRHAVRLPSTGPEGAGGQSSWLRKGQTAGAGWHLPVHPAVLLLAAGGLEVFPGLCSRDHHHFFHSCRSGAAIHETYQRTCPFLLELSRPTESAEPV